VDDKNFDEETRRRQAESDGLLKQAKERDKEKAAAAVLTCGCGVPVGPGTKYLAVQVNEDGSGLTLKVGCEHLPVPDIEAKVRDGSAYVFGSGGCFLGWLNGFLGDSDCGHGKGTH
jgi:hypothetical protein